MLNLKKQSIKRRKMNRKTFLIAGLFTLMIAACGSKQKADVDKAQNSIKAKEDSLRAVLSDSDLLLLDSLFYKADTGQWDTLSNEELLSNVGKYFLGIPYVAHTLEMEGEEQVVMNLCSLDCVTYLETVLALSKSIKNEDYSVYSYHDNLKDLRYRQGEVNGYTSRLHYFIEWLKDNEQLGLVSIVTNELKVDAFDKQINFMTRHVSSYQKLAADSILVQEMKQIEEKISSEEMYYISEDKLPENEQHIKDGDLIIFATSIEGLDVSHVGFAHWKGDNLHFMHASTGDMKVVVSDLTLYEYLLDMKKNTGILVARALL